LVLPLVNGRSIAGEVAALDRVREAIGHGDGTAALAGLERYRAAFPAGVLKQEAAVLQIEALWRTGARSEARARIDGFAREYPGSPHLERLRALTAGDTQGHGPGRAR
jgi:outer membrane protein assembly factor BamD (BamD/ComL family)